MNQNRRNEKRMAPPTGTRVGAEVSAKLDILNLE
jgi:hypothetical protein